MPGYNHYSDCSCGWCVQHGGEHLVASFSSRFVNTAYDPTRPNASCPVCRAPVFFWASPYGGRVYFDEMGPPWPKHPCTDTKAHPMLKLPPPENQSVRLRAWEHVGWRAVEVLERYEKASPQDRARPSGWWVLRLALQAGGRERRVLCDEEPELPADSLAFISAWSADGVGSVAWLDFLGAEPVRRKLTMWRPARYAELDLDFVRSLEEVPQSERGHAALKVVFESMILPGGFFDEAVAEELIQDLHELAAHAPIGWQLERAAIAEMEAAVRAVLLARSAEFATRVMSVLKACY